MDHQTFCVHSKLRFVKLEHNKLEKPFQTAKQWTPALLPKKLSRSFSYLINHFNTATLSIRPDFRGPLVTGLTGSTVVASVSYSIKSAGSSYRY